MDFAVGIAAHGQPPRPHRVRRGLPHPRHRGSRMCRPRGMKALERGDRSVGSWASPSSSEASRRSGTAGVEVSPHANNPRNAAERRHNDGSASTGSHRELRASSNVYRRRGRDAGKKAGAGFEPANHGFAILRFRRGNRFAIRWSVNGCAAKVRGGGRGFWRGFVSRRPPRAHRGRGAAQPSSGVRTHP